MTAPIDPRPYAAPTDLVTAADVARWLHEIDGDDITGGDPMWLTISRLDARLDRERRQACRRGALDRWRRVRELVRWAGAYRNAPWAWHEIAPSLWFALRDALAFRAAARAK
jgi:hypothetical protein